MPETNVERIVLLLGLCAIGVLVFLLVGRGHRTARPSAIPTVVTTPAATTSAAGTSVTLTSTAPAGPAQLAHIVLSATRGDCWVVVRSRSARGRLVFAGTITQGTKKRFTGTRLWLRLGAAGNLTGWLNGARIAIPSGSPTIVATAAGIHVLAVR